jgi:hypothetical protein
VFSRALTWVERLLVNHVILNSATSLETLSFTRFALSYYFKLLLKLIILCIK